jgi:hypothetical protein
MFTLQNGLMSFTVPIISRFAPVRCYFFDNPPPPPGKEIEENTTDENQLHIDNAQDGKDD